MKIFYLITKSEIGGAQTHVAQLCHYFVKRGDEVMVMAGGTGWLQAEVEKNGGRYVTNKYLANTFNLLKLFKAGQEVKQVVGNFLPDIVCCHSSAAGLVGRLTIHNQVPTVFTAHGWDFAAYRPGWRRLLVRVAERLAGVYCTKIICVSNFVKELALENKIIEENKLAVIYNGIELPERVGRVRPETEPLKIIFVGRLAKPKNPFVLVEAYAKLPVDLLKKSELIIIGEGPQVDKLKNFIYKLKLNDKVKLTGSLPRSQMFSLLAESAIAVLPSSWESFGLSALEAMSLEVPVIVANVGGLKELAVNDSGILFDSITDLARALEKLLRDEKFRQELGKKGRERAQSFTVEIMYKKTLSLYEEIIKIKN